MLPSILSARWVLQGMGKGSDSWCLQDRLSVVFGETARVDTSAAVGSSGVGVSYCFFVAMREK